MYFTRGVLLFAPTERLNKRAGACFVQNGDKFGSPAPPPESIVNEDASQASDYGVAVCYLCLDEGINKTGQPLRRDCACRGTDAGYVHLECLAGFAAFKSELADKMSLGMNELTKPWRECPSCHQKYQNKLAINIATEFVSFVQRQYPDDTQMQVESLNLKLCALLTCFPTDCNLFKRGKPE